ncbi:MAG: EVE domain-containing protein, partial [Leifsonia sp.]
MTPGDGFVYYSPKDVYPDGHSLRAFTAIGVVAPGEVWQGSQVMGAGSDIRPWRRKVDWDEAASEAPITPLLDVLELTRGIRNWGLQLQKGHLPLSEHDFRIIAHEMGADGLLP